MRAFFVAVICSGAILAQTALAQTQSSTVPTASAQAAAPGAATTAPSPAATAAAETAPAAVSVQSANSGVNLDEIVCKMQPPTTGSRLGGGRECHTVREWNLREKEAQELTRQQEREGLAVKGSGIAK